MDRDTGYKVNELLLVFIVAIQILDFFKLLPPFWDYINKIVNWVLMGALLYAASPSDIVFGEKHEGWDAAIVVACFAMVLKNIISFAAVAREEMLENVLLYVRFVPQAAEGLRSAITIPLSDAAYSTYSLTGYLANASVYAKPFASQITVANPSVGMTLQAGSESLAVALEPYGLDGMTFQIYNSLLANSAAIQQWGFIAGATALIALGIYAALRFHAHEKSALTVIHEAGEVKDARHALVRAFSVLFLLAVFFVIVFNLAVEWLAMAVDAPLAMVGIAAAALIVVRSRRRGEDDGESFLDRAGGFGNDFLEGFGKLFDEKRTVLLGLSGLLVLHLLTDIGNFIIPYLTGLVDPLYFSRLGAGHEPLFRIIASSWTGSLVRDAALTALYALNVTAVLVLLGLPAYIWYKAYKIRTRPEGEAEHHHHPDIPGWLVSLSLVSVAAFFLAPAFRFASVRGPEVIGVDLQTRAIAASSPEALVLGLLAAFAVLLAVSLRWRLQAMALLFVASIAFFGYYVTLFFMATVQYYIIAAVSLLREGGAAHLFLGASLFLFLVINLLFYVFSFLSFAYETWRE